MARFSFVGTIGGLGLQTPAAIATLFERSDGQLGVEDFGAGLSTTVDVSALGLSVQTGLPISHGNDVTGFTLDGENKNVLTTVLDAAAGLAAGEGDTSEMSSLHVQLNGSPSFVNAAEMVAANVGGTTFVYIAGSAGQGVSVFEKQGNTLISRGHQDDEGDAYASGITAMATVETGAGTFLYVGSGTEHGLSGYRIGTDGRLTHVEDLGAGNQLPVGAITAIEPISIAGDHFLIAASSITSSLTVLRIEDNGEMTSVDHVMDTLETRFGTVTALDAIEVDGRVYVVAGGGDDGLSLFTMLPDGHLVHLDTIADDALSSLNNVSAVEIVETADGLQIFAASAAEAGVSQFSVDLSAQGRTITGEAARTSSTASDDILQLDDGGGFVTLRGGNDVVLDGAGLDTILGQGGRDTFVFTKDGQDDVIRDFRLNEDRLDLSMIAPFYTIDQINFLPHDGGVILDFGGERLVIETANGRSLERSDFAPHHFVGLTRFDVAPEEERSPMPDPIAPPPPREDPVTTPYEDPTPEPEETPAPPPSREFEGDGADNRFGGTSANESFNGRGGDDLFIGGGGADRFDGGRGIDTVSYAGTRESVTIDLSDPSNNGGAARNDSFTSIERIIGSETRDFIYGTPEDDVLDGGGGNDWIQGGRGDDHIIGGDGNDEIMAEAGDDLIEGGRGDDTLSASDGNDIVYGGEGRDNMGGGEGNDRIYGGDGNDTIGAGPGDDWLDAGDGNDITSGGPGQDTVIGGAGNDTMAGSFGTDHIEGGDGDDMLGGGYGFDVMYGGNGNDSIGSGYHADTVYGEAGNDFLSGEDGDDYLDGGSGDDRINSGKGNDTLVGGTGRDTFIFHPWEGRQVDTIRDFEPGIDTISMIAPGRSVYEKYGGLTIRSATVEGTSGTEIVSGETTIRLRDIKPSEIEIDDFSF
ncbi:hypothetical protein AAD018_015680 [Aestuariibius insulae]|uniref:hypothetical protein n=1 Tax=Aestuariibius insulae TaxID=2058287 RepID=UPI00398EB7B2